MKCKETLLSAGLDSHRYADIAAIGSHRDTGDLAIDHRGRHDPHRDGRAGRRSLASAFCRQLGIRFPQASVRASILAVGPVGQELPAALHTAAVSVTRRGDGGYTLAISGRGRVDPTPQKVRFAREFVPMFVRRWRSLAPGGLKGWRAGFETLDRWRPDAPSPMERVRTLDPAPDQRQIRDTYQRAGILLPALQRAPITAAWAGYIDSTPDGIPAISEAQGLPGLILAAGFQRSRLRHRPGRGAPRCRPDHGCAAAGGSCTVSSRAVRRFGLGQGGGLLDQ